MPRESTHPFDALLDHAIYLLAERVAALMPKSAAPAKATRAAPTRVAPTRAPGGLSANQRRRKAMLGRKLDMSCRVVGCKNRSGGPGKGYMCSNHQSLPKKKQQEARDAWKAKRAG